MCNVDEVAAFALLLAVSLVAAPAPVGSSLVAYYNFDGADSLSALSGNCPNVIPTATVSGAAAVVNISCHFSNCLKPGSGYVDTGAWRVFQGFDTSQMTIAAWVTAPSSISAGVILYKSSLISLSYTTTCLICPYTLKCTFTFNAQQSLTVSVGSSPFAAGSAYHVACTYDGQQMCLYINGASRACANIKSVFTEGATEKLLIGSDGSTSWAGTIDEVKVYDHALPAADVALLYGASAANDAPTVQITTNGTVLAASYSAPALTLLDLAAEVTDARAAFSGAAQTGNYAASFVYTWDALTSQCGIVEVADSAGQTAQVKLIDIGSFTLHLCASDGEVANEAVVSMFITASKPQLIRQPTLSIVQIPGTSSSHAPFGALDYPISVEAEGLPAPSYQWQQLVTVEHNITTNSTGGTNSTTPGNSTIARRDHSFHAERAIVSVDEFQDMEGQTEGTLLVNGTSEFNGTVVRCLIFNGGGSILTNNFTVIVNGAPFGPFIPSGGSDDTTVAIIAGAVGGGGGLLLLCCLALAVGAFVWGWRRGRSPYRRLKQPDYDAIAYGDVTGDVTLPKKQLDQFHTLERLLIAPGLQLAQAILRTSNNNIGETDQVCRGLLRVLEDNEKGAELIMASISHEVAKADDEAILFRANSIAAKLFSSYAKMAIMRYLWHVLVLSVHSLNDNAIESFTLEQDQGGGASSRRSGAGSQMHASRVGRYKIDLEYGDEEAGGASSIFSMSTMELDPSKISDVGDLTINTLELWLVAQKLLKYITESERRMPRELRQIIARLHEEVGSKFNEMATYRAMGGFYFLRLICPALMAPQAFGLLDEPPHQVAQRQLILVSKVLQNLANDTLPGAKEEFMEKLNSFITTNQPVLARFYEEIVDQPDKGKPAQVAVPEAVKNDALLGLHKYIVANVAAIEAELRASSGSDEEQEAAEDLINALNYVLKQMGDLDGEGRFISDDDLGDLDL